MKKFILPLLAVFAASAAYAQTEITLGVGDPAPAFKVDGHVKGDKISALKKGEIYIIEFWATWCGPCIAVFPHLSELTEKYKGQVTTISVNSWDYRGDADRDAHIKKIENFLVKHGDNMRYNIVLDDAADTMANTWMRAAGQNGIPNAFIVNEEGRIAWIGHPATMDKPLEQIVAKTWDIDKAAADFKKEIEAAKEAAANRAKMAEIAKNGDMAAYDAMVEKMGAQEALFAVINHEPNFVVRVIEKYAGKIEGVLPDTYCSMAAYLTRNKATTAESRATITKISEMCFNELSEDKAARSAVYHAQVLMNNGDKDGAKAWLDKAEGLVTKFNPETQRAGLTKMIADTRKQLDAS